MKSGCGTAAIRSTCRSPRPTTGPVRTVRLGGQVTAGEEPQAVVPAGQWQSATPVEDGAAGYTLISCIVAPAFEFSGFELAEPGWMPGPG